MHSSSIARSSAAGRRLGEEFLARLAQARRPQETADMIGAETAVATSIPPWEGRIAWPLRARCACNRDAPGPKRDCLAAPLPLSVRARRPPLEISDDPLRPDDRDDRSRPEGRAGPEARLRRDREPAGLPEGPRRFRQPRRQARGKAAVRGALEEAAGLRLRDGGERPGRGDATSRIPGISTRSTRRPIFCTRSRSSRSPSRSSARGRSSRAWSTIRPTIPCMSRKKGRAPGATTGACASPAAPNFRSR